MSGVVRDSSGGALPGADVTITKIDTGAVRSVVTGVDGAYVFPNLPVGPYQLKVELQGFNTYQQDGIVLQVSSNPQINVSMAVGTVSETVTVIANSAMVETHSTGIGQVVDNQRVVELPLNGRQATELIFLAGLATSAPAGDLNTNKNFPTVTISVAGGQANGMTYIMDGGTHNDPFNNLNLPTPFPDAMQEFKVETSSLPARYGHHAASAVNIITKSGTNSFKGSAFEFNRDYHFNAKNHFATTRDSLRRNTFGGTLGGPMIKNKAFFFGGYQGQIEKTNPPTSISYIPTRAMLNGDFTAFASPACNGGTQRNLTGGFVNNQIDPSRLSPIAQNFAKYLPVDQADQCGKVQYGIPQNNTEHRALTKIDYTLNNQQSIFTRYLYAVYDNPATYDGKNVLTLSRTGQNNQAHSVVVGHNFVLASFVNALRVTYNKTLNDRPLPEFFTATDLGSKVYSPLPGYMGISVTGNGFAVGNGGTNPGYFDSDSWQLADDVDVLQGQPSDLGWRQLDPHQDRDAEQPPDQRRVHVQRPEHGPVAGRLHDGRAQRRFPAGQSRLRLRRSRLHRRLCAGRLARGAERDRQRRRALGAVHPAAQHLQLGEQLRSGALQRRHQEHGVSAGAGRTAVPRRQRLSGPRHDRTPRWRSSRRASAPSGRRAATATPASAPAGACSTTRRTCSSTRALRTTRRGARRSRCRIPPAAGPTRTRRIPAAIHSRRSTPGGPRSRSRRSAST